MCIEKKRSCGLSMEYYTNPKCWWDGLVWCLHALVICLPSEPHATHRDTHTCGAGNVYRCADEGEVMSLKVASL